MKKIVVFVLFFTVILSFGIEISASAEELPEAPECASEAAGEEITEKNSAGLMSFGNILETAVRIFVQAFTGRSGFLVQMLAVVFAVWITDSLAASSLSDKLVSVMSFSVTASAGVSLFSVIFSAVKNLSESYAELSGFLAALIPSFLAAVASSGFPSSAAAGGASLVFVSELFSTVINSFLMPFVNGYLCMGVASGISGNGNLRSVSSFIKNFTVTALTLVITLFCGVMSLQTTLAMTADTLSKRAARFAAGSFIPVFGGSLGESLETAFASSLVLRGSIGAFGTASVFFTLLIPTAEIAADFVTVSAVCAVCSFFENNTVSDFLSVARDCLIILLAASFAVMIMILAGISILMKIQG